VGKIAEKAPIFEKLIFELHLRIRVPKTKDLSAQSLTINHVLLYKHNKHNIQIMWKPSKLFKSLIYLKAGANQSNISSNIAFLPCWMKCWTGLRRFKIYKFSKKKKKIMLDDVG